MKLLFLPLFLFLCSFTFARERPKLKDVGVIGLMSHDLFTWDRLNEINT